MKVGLMITKLISSRDQTVTLKKLMKDQISIFNTWNKNNVIKDNNLNS